mgnify:CR=1 FL=1
MLLKPTSWPSHLVPGTIYRDGPRFIVTSVHDGASSYLLKQVKLDTPSTDPSTKNPGAEISIRTPYSELRVERAFMDWLDHLPRLGEPLTPRLISYGDEPTAWYLRDYAPGPSLGYSASPFFFNLARLERVKPTQLAARVQAITELTPQVPAAHPLTNPNRRQALWQQANDYSAHALACLSATLRPAAAACRSLAIDIRTAAPQTLVHGEMYPPHIIGKPSSLMVIDWENVRLDHRYTDHLAVWLRAFERPDWQNAYLAAVQQFDSFDRRLWEASLFLSTLSTAYYLAEQDRMTPDRRLPAIQYCHNLMLRLISQLAPHA